MRFVVALIVLGFVSHNVWAIRPRSGEDNSKSVEVGSSEVSFGSGKFEGTVTNLESGKRQKRSPGSEEEEDADDDKKGKFWSKIKDWTKKITNFFDCLSTFS